MHLMISKRIKC